MVVGFGLLMRDYLRIVVKTTYLRIEYSMYKRLNIYKPVHRVFLWVVRSALKNFETPLEPKLRGV